MEKYFLVHDRDCPPLCSQHFIAMIIPSEFFFQLNLGFDRILFILLMNFVKPFHSFLVLCAHANLLKLCFLFPFALFLVKLLQLLP